MLNYLARLLFIITVCASLFACHKPPTLDEKLALSLLMKANIRPGYAVNMVTNNPHARGKKAQGWNCSDKQPLIDALVVTCKNSGRSGVYLSFTHEGKKLLLGKPWGDETLRNARVIAVRQKIKDIQSIHLMNNTHAIISYSWVYHQHTPFSNPQLKKLIALDVPQPAQASATLINNQWTIQRDSL